MASRHVNENTLLIRCSPRQMFTNELACLVKLFSFENAGATRLVKAWSKKRKIYPACRWERGKDVFRAARVEISVAFLFFLFFFIVVANVHLSIINSLREMP